MINVTIVFSTIKAIKFVSTFTILSRRITIVGSLIFISSTKLVIVLHKQRMLELKPNYNFFNSWKKCNC